MTPTDKIPAPPVLKDCNWVRFFDECLIEEESPPLTKHRTQDRDSTNKNNEHDARQTARYCNTLSAAPAKSHADSSSLPEGFHRYGERTGMERFRSKVKQVFDDLMSKKVPHTHRLKMPHDDYFDEIKLKEWVVQWDIVLRDENSFNWREIFSNHDICFSTNKTSVRCETKNHKSQHKNQQTLSRTENVFKTTALKVFMEIFLECIWNAHLCRLNAFVESWKVCHVNERVQWPMRNSSDSNCKQYLEMINKWQLHSLQNLFLDLWIDCRHQNSSYNKYNFISTDNGAFGARGIAGQTKTFHSCNSSPSDHFMMTCMNKITCLFSTPVASLPIHAPQPRSTAFSLDLGKFEVSNPPTISWTDALEGYTESICSDFLHLFKKDEYATKTSILANVKTKLQSGDHKEEMISFLVSKARSFVELIAGLQKHLALPRFQRECEVMLKMENWCDAKVFCGELGPSGQFNQCVVSQVLTNSIVAILSTLDDIDVKNLIAIRHKRKKRKIKTTTTSAVSCNTKRNRLPANLNSSDVIAAMHGELDVDGKDSTENAMNPLLAIRNTDRNKRARRLHNVTASDIRVSMKEVLRAPESHEKKDSAENLSINCDRGLLDDNKTDLVSTLSLEAAILRRDLYKFLSEIDSLGIKVLRDMMTSRPNGRLVIDMSSISQSKIKAMVSRLMKRLTSYSSSPSVRLSAVLAIDHLRELRLSDSGYRQILDSLLELFLESYTNFPSDGLHVRLPNEYSNSCKSFCPLKLYADIVSECDAFSSHSRLLPALCQLMEESLCIKANMIAIGNESASFAKVSTILQAISHIMVRRQSTISRLHCCDSNFAHKDSKAIDLYRQLKHNMSLSFETSSYWLQPTMPREVQERILCVLQSEGILSLFCDFDHSDCENTTERDEAIFQNILTDNPGFHGCTLRSAHDRMGPCAGFNRLLSHESTYTLEMSDLKLQMPPSTPKRTSQEEPDDDSMFPFSIANFDTIVSVFEFLGYRSLARASQCCKSWRQASVYNSLWANIYFSKYPNAKFDLEVLTNEYFDCTKENNEDNKLKTITFQNKSQRLNYANALTWYDWKVIFKNKYCIEKMLRKKRWNFSKSSDADVCKSKPRSCDIIGCTVVLHSAKKADDHRRIHAKNVISREKKRVECEKLGKKVSALRSVAKTLEVNAASTPSNFLTQQNEAAEIDSPEALLKRLIFPFLDFFDLQSLSITCKIWKQMGECDSLWKHLYTYHFGEPCVKWLDHTDISSLMNGEYLQGTWKHYFIKAYFRRRSIKQHCNGFGWAARLCPLLGCGLVLRNKLDYDKHILKHEERYLVHRIKEMRTISKHKRRQKK